MTTATEIEKTSLIPTQVDIKSPTELTDKDLIGPETSAPPVTTTGIADITTHDATATSPSEQKIDSGVDRLEHEKFINDSFSRRELYYYEKFRAMENQIALLKQRILHARIVFTTDTPSSPQ